MRGPYPEPINETMMGEAIALRCAILRYHQEA